MKFKNVLFFFSILHFPAIWYLFLCWCFTWQVDRLNSFQAIVFQCIFSNLISEPVTVTTLITSHITFETGCNTAVDFKMNRCHFKTHPIFKSLSKACWYFMESLSVLLKNLSNRVHWHKPFRRRVVWFSKASVFAWLTDWCFHSRREDSYVTSASTSTHLWTAPYLFIPKREKKWPQNLSVNPRTLTVWVPPFRFNHQEHQPLHAMVTMSSLT